MIGGVDKAFIAATFDKVKAGAFGKLDPQKVILRGWSGGAQMVSWMFQVLASDKTYLPDIKVIAGVMLSGGSYTCYNDANPGEGGLPVDPVGTCKGCTEGGPDHCQDDPLCDSCSVGVATYCGQVRFGPRRVPVGVHCILSFPTACMSHSTSL